MDSFGFMAQHFRLWITQELVIASNLSGFALAFFEKIVWIGDMTFPLLLLLCSSPPSRV